MKKDTATDKLKRALTEAGIPFELDDAGEVLASEEVVAYLNAKEALHDPENPVVKTAEELTGEGEEGADEVEEPWYEFRVSEAIVAELEAGDVEIGDSDLESKSARHNTIEAYVGDITELQGKGVLLKRNPDDTTRVAVQFDDNTLVLNNRALGFGWHDFPAEHFSDARPFIDRWRDIPSALRAHMRRAKNIPRIHKSGERFLTPKESRRNTGGAFGGPGARRARVSALREQHKHVYLVNVVTDGDEENKSLAVRALTQRGAERAAFMKHKNEFPEVEILSVEAHKETVRQQEVSA